MTSGGGIGPEGGPIFAPPAPQQRLGMDPLDISNFNPGDPTDDRGNPAYVKKMRRWMETQGNRAEQYVEFREQQERQASGDSSWLYEAKQRGKQQALAEVKRQNRRSTWGFVFNLREIVPAGSQADNYLAATKGKAPRNRTTGRQNQQVEWWNAGPEEGEMGQLTGGQEVRKRVAVGDKLHVRQLRGAASLHAERTA